MEITFDELEKAIMSLDFKDEYYNLKGNTEDELDYNQKTWIFNNIVEKILKNK